MALKVAIVTSGLTQRKVALACRMPEHRLSDIVCGLREPRDTERHAIAAALGKSVDEVFPQPEALASAV
jgi:transcriptional regulator with XRE-family HTH domain